MREIKFKYIFKGFPFSSTNSGFNWHVKVFTLSQIEGGTLRLSNLEDALGHIVARVQFTGQADVDGVEVYEGDIVKWDDACITMIVEWSDEGAAFVPRNIRSKGGAMINADYMANYRVIGNKYQNPELMEQS